MEKMASHYTPPRKDEGELTKVTTGESQGGQLIIAANFLTMENWGATTVLFWLAVNFTVGER